ncbi:hypothetical protein QO209_23525 [Pseudomonas citronellolis]|uniref:hypothetical protein n=1 Tax=Pseudomonas citronellolis TaxID=53408 RepID=UPI002647E801|nr:hypothetical protein [Pseudomonas citronellolis]MDN6875421.1 hypothetical protein [Pseudomonas citronellolis]
MNIYSLDQVVNIARTNSTIYQKLYTDMQHKLPYSLTELPILTNKLLMEFVHNEQPDFVFSNGNTHGLIFESSASTGKPKVTLFGRDEWDTHTRLLASQHWKNGSLRENDRLTNLCASAYLSYRIVHGVVERFPGKISEIPLGCDYEYEYIHSVIEKYRSNVLTGINSTFLGLAYHMLQHGLVNYNVERLLGGGELLYGAQLKIIQRAFPKAEIISFMFGTTETGVLGYSELGDALNEFSIFDDACIVEIIDELTGQPISESNKVGRCVATSLTRIAAPAIRIDTGDYACWVQSTSGKRKLRVIGRMFPFHHQFHSVRINETNIFNLIRSLEDKFPITCLQLQILDSKLEVIVSLLQEQEIEHLNTAVCEGLLDQVPGLHAYRQDISCQSVNFGYFSEATRRKGRLIVDKRQGGVPGTTIKV